MSESCSEAGIAVSPVSRIALVSSSTNSGTPSVRATIASIISGGSRSPPSLRHDRLDPGAAQAVEGEAGDMGVGGERRLAVRPAGQQDQHPGALRSGPGACSIISSVVGSIQWASSRTTRTGCRAASPSSCSTSAARVRARCACGVRSSGP